MLPNGVFQASFGMLLSSTLSHLRDMLSVRCLIREKVLFWFLLPFCLLTVAYVVILFWFLFFSSPLNLQKSLHATTPAESVTMKEMYLDWTYRNGGYKKVKRVFTR